MRGFNRFFVLHKGLLSVGDISFFSFDHFSLFFSLRVSAFIFFGVLQCKVVFDNRASFVLAPDKVRLNSKMTFLRHLKKPPPYVLASMLCSANGILFGMDTGVIGPVTDMKDFKASFGGSQNATIHGLIVSSILIPAALSSFFAGHLADKLGRPNGISIGVFIFGIGAAIEAAAVRLGMFIAGRVVEGLGEGLFLGMMQRAPSSTRLLLRESDFGIGTLVVYIAEISPTSTRGPLTTGPQLLITLGIMTGYFTCYGSSGIHSSLSWRTPFILLACLSMILCAASLFCLPPSPRWLTLHGRQAEAEEAWEKLGVSRVEREKVELESEVPELSTPGRKAKPSIMNKLLDIFSKDVRARTALVVFMMAMQQLSGIDGVLYVRHRPLPLLPKSVS